MQAFFSAPLSPSKARERAKMQAFFFAPLSPSKARERAKKRNQQTRRLDYCSSSNRHCCSLAPPLQHPPNQQRPRYDRYILNERAGTRSTYIHAHRLQSKRWPEEKIKHPRTPLTIARRRGGRGRGGLLLRNTNKTQAVGILISLLTLGAGRGFRF